MRSTKQQEVSFAIPINFLIKLNNFWYPDSPYARIFKEYYHNDAYPIKPHVFGMTASPVFNVQDK